MDSQQFERLVQALASGARAVACGLGTVALGGVGAAPSRAPQPGGAPSARRRRMAGASRAALLALQRRRLLLHAEDLLQQGNSVYQTCVAPASRTPDPCNKGVQVCGYLHRILRTTGASHPSCRTPTHARPTLVTVPAAPPISSAQISGGVASVCVDPNGCGICDGSGGQPTRAEVCVAKGCQDFSSAGQCGPSGDAGGLQRIPGLRPSS